MSRNMMLEYLRGIKPQKIINEFAPILIEDDRFPVRDNPPQRTSDFPSDPIKSGSTSSTTRQPSPAEAARNAAREENDRIKQEKRDAATAAAVQAVKDRIAAREQGKQDAAARRSADYRYDDVEAVRSRRPASTQSSTTTNTNPTGTSSASGMSPGSLTDIKSRLGM